MHLKTLTLLALAGLSTAETLRFTRITPRPFGLARRDGGLGDGYTPEETECGDGDTCSEACGAGYEQCGKTDGVSSCFNPGDGEVCCDAGVGASCQKGFFCAHDNTETTVCCAEGMSLEECAALNNADGGLTSDALSSDAPSSTAPSSTAPSSTAPSSNAPSSNAPSSNAPSSSAPSSSAPSSTAEPTTAKPTTAESAGATTSALATTFTSAPASTSFASNGTTAAPTGTGAAPSSTLPVEEGPDSGAAGVVPAVALLVGAVALVL